MLTIDSNNNMRITRGDSAYLTLNIKKSDGTAYEMTAADYLVFAIKRKNSPTIIKRQEGDAASNVLRIPPQITQLNLGDYLYDIQLFHNFYVDTNGDPMSADDAIEAGIEPCDWDEFTIISAALTITNEVGKRINTTT